MEHSQDQAPVSEPSQLGFAVVPAEHEMKPPWRPRVSGIVGFLCGPLSAALVTFINLRRLKKRRKAAWTLALTILASAAYGLLIARAPENMSMTLAKLIGNFVSPFLYPLLQWRDSEEWIRSNQGATYDHGWRSSGWAIIGLAGFLAIALGAALASSPGDEVQDVEVRYDMPQTAKVGDTLVLTVTVRNTADHPQLLYSLDVDTHFLEGISIQRTDPAFEKSEPNMLAPIKSYIFRQNIPSKSEIEIDLEGRALKPGTYPLSLDVCVKTALMCSEFKLNTITVQ